MRLFYKSILIIFALILVNGFIKNPVSADSCVVTGPFNAPGRHGCQGLLVMTSSNTSGFRYIRFFGGGGPYDTGTVNENLGFIPSDSYFLPLNEPDLEWRNVPFQDVIDIILYWDSVLPNSVKMIVPPFAHGEGAVDEGDITQLQTLLAAIRNGTDTNKRTWVLGANVYGGTANPVEGAKTIISRLNQVIGSNLDILSGMVITELGFIAHKCVDNGAVELKDWMAGTAGLMQAMHRGELGTPDGTVSFSAFLSGTGRQIPVFFQDLDRIYYEPGPTVIQQADIDRVLGGGLADVNTATCQGEEEENLPVACEEAKRGNADACCYSCSGTAVLTDLRSFWERLGDLVGDFIKNLFNQQYAMVVKVIDNEGPVVDHKKCEITAFTGEESSLAFFLGCDNNGSLDPDDPDYAWGGSSNEGFVFRRTENFQVALAPEYTATQSDLVNCMDTKTRQQILIDSAVDSLEVAQERIWCALSLISPIANSIWSTPYQNQISFTPPPGMSESEFITQGVLKERNKFLAAMRQQNAAQNYSYQDK